MNYHKCLFLSWSEVSAIVSEEVSSILHRPISCIASNDDETYWGVSLDGFRLPISDVWHIFEAVTTDEALRRETLTTDEDVTSVRDLGMRLCRVLLKKHLEQEWSEEKIKEDGLWLLNISKEQDQKQDTVTIGGISILKKDLKSRDEVLNYLAQSDLNPMELNECLSYPQKKYGRQLFWHYPISDEIHAGAYFVPVLEGFLSIPYENNEELLYDEAKMLDEQSLSLLYEDWTRFSANIQAVMQEMLTYFRERI